MSDEKPQSDTPKVRIVLIEAEGDAVNQSLVDLETILHGLSDYQKRMEPKNDE